MCVKPQRKGVKFILLQWVKHYTKEIAKALEITIFGALIISLVVWIKYKPAYEVELLGEKLGYIENKENLELEYKNYIENISGNVAFREKTAMPEYELKLINRDKQTKEEEILLALEATVKTTYRTYAVTVDGVKQASVSTQEEAKNIVETLKSDIDADRIGFNIGIIEEYTDNLQLQSAQEASGILNTFKVAKITAYNEAQETKRKTAQEEAKKKIISTKTVQSVGTIAGINLAKPVSGSITSRYGSRSSIRSGSHTGLDIATSSGTPITPIAPGTVTCAQRKGSYGNLVIVNHGNGIESYYAHCSVIYAAVGQQVDCHTVISAVGSTGNSTGPHLHLEIRQNGTPLNPEDYLY